MNCIFFNRLFFRAVLDSQQNWAESTKTAIHCSPHQSGTFVTICEFTVTHHYHLTSVVDIRAHSGGVHSIGFEKCIMICGYHCIIQSSSTSLKILCAPPIHPPTSTPGNRHWSLSVSIALPSPECGILAIIQYVAFSNWLFSLSNMHLSFLHVFSWLDISNNITLPGYTWFIYLFTTKGHLGCLQVLAIMNKAAICSGFCVEIGLHLLWKMPRSMIAESYGKSMFSFIRKTKLFQSGCNILHSYQQWMRVPIAPHFSSVLDYNHSNRCVVISHFNFSFYNYM